MNQEACPVFSYSDEQFSLHVKQGQKSQFDLDLESCWQECMEKGFFRYNLDDVKTKHIPGKYGFIAQLNIKRALERRKPQFVSDVVMPFDYNLFHFGKVQEKEILFLLNPLHRTSEKSIENTEDPSLNALVINVSPLEYCHSLLVPSIEKCYPQVLTFNGLKLALETMLIGYNPDLRLGFNSLGAYASVNHLHFHIYYLHKKLYLQHAPVKHLMGECYELECFPSQGFAFQLLEKKNLVSLTRSIMRLIEHFIEKRIAHNVFMTRGTEFSESSGEESNAFNSVRIYVWARESSFGAKNDLAFNPALCELGGHLPIKDQKYFETVTEDDVSSILQNICYRMYAEVKDDIKHLYKE